MSKKHKHKQPEPAPLPEDKNEPKPITATATTDGIKEFVDQFNKRDDYIVQPRFEE
jgi:hypothetical protein